MTYPTALNRQLLSELITRRITAVPSSSAIDVGAPVLTSLFKLSRSACCHAREKHVLGVGINILERRLG